MSFWHTSVFHAYNFQVHLLFYWWCWSSWQCSKHSWSIIKSWALQYFGNFGLLDECKYRQTLKYLSVQLKWRITEKRLYLQLKWSNSRYVTKVLRFRIHQNKIKYFSSPWIFQYTLEVVHHIDLRQKWAPASTNSQQTMKVQSIFLAFNVKGWQKDECIENDIKTTTVRTKFFRRFIWFPILRDLEWAVVGRDPTVSLPKKALWWNTQKIFECWKACTKISNDMIGIKKGQVYFFSVSLYCIPQSNPCLKKVNLKRNTSQHFSKLRKSNKNAWSFDFGDPNLTGGSPPWQLLIGYSVSTIHPVVFTKISFEQRHKLGVFRFPNWRKKLLVETSMADSSQLPRIQGIR